MGDINILKIATTTVGTKFARWVNSIGGFHEHFGDVCEKNSLSPPGNSSGNNFMRDSPSDEDCVPFEMTQYMSPVDDPFRLESYKIPYLHEQFSLELILNALLTGLKLPWNTDYHY